MDLIMLRIFDWLVKLILGRYRVLLEKRIDPKNFNKRLSRKIDALLVLESDFEDDTKES